MATIQNSPKLGAVMTARNPDPTYTTKIIRYLYCGSKIINIVLIKHTDGDFFLNDKYIINQVSVQDK
jgi:hypothetical protein